MATAKKTSPRSTLRKDATVPYKKYSEGEDPYSLVLKTPSMLLQSIAAPPDYLEGWRPKPTIVELLNMNDFTHQTASRVPVDEPLFQPFPPTVEFHGFEAFHSYSVALALRNNDDVPRRVKVLAPDSPYFKVREVHAAAAGSKCAAGMESAYVVEFTPQSTASVFCDLVVCTEREKFVVPIRANGAVGALNVPDAIEFQPTPCKIETTQTFLLRNVGRAEATFDVSIAGPAFSVVPTQGRLAPDGTVQLCVAFNPPCKGPHDAQLIVKYAGGETTYTRVTGSGVELDVCLEKDDVQFGRVPCSAIEMLPTFIKTRSQRTLYIVNRSAEIVKFSWRKLQSKLEELARREAEATDIEEAEREAVRAVEDADAADEARSEAGSSYDGDYTASEASLEGTSAAQEAHRLRLARQDVEHDRQLFATDNELFGVYPLEGSVWPGTELEITVRFGPLTSGETVIEAYCDLSGLGDRVPVTLAGKGVGPKALLSYDVLNVGDTYINSVHQYEVELMNRGDIPAEYSMQPHGDTMFGSKFKFEPDSGILAVGQVQPVLVTFASNFLGVVDESFKWNIVGSDQTLELQFIGEVVGPTFNFDVESLEFGVISYGFSYQKEVNITNTSEIPMKFLLRVPVEYMDSVDDPEVPDEFTITPAAGAILPGATQKVSIELTSRTIMHYDTSLIMDIPGVRSDAHLIPVTADCCIPRVSIPTDTMEFGDCFIRHPYSKSFKIVNDSKLPAKFRVLPQDGLSEGLAIYTASIMEGSIPAKGETEIDFSLATMRLGKIHLLAKLEIVGSTDEPLEVTISARSIGPILSYAVESLAGEMVPTTAPAIDYGKLEVLRRHERHVTVTNASHIPAEFKTYITGMDASVYQVDVREAKLMPADSMTLTVSCYLDDTIPFNDTLNVLVMEGEDVAMPLSTVGTGSTITCEAWPPHEVSVVDFGPQFTNRGFEREFILHNYGRRTQTLTWTNTTKRPSKKGTGGGKDKREPEEFNYSIYPPKVTMAPKTSCAFTISGFVKAPGLVHEVLQCKSAIGKANKVVFDVNIHADVARPLLEFSSDRVEFYYQYTPETFPPEVQHKPLTVRNVSKLPLTFTMKPGHPYVLERSEWTLAPEETGTTTITFDPNCRGDRLTMTFPAKIGITYSDNPQKDSVELYAEVHYPNLSFDHQMVNFGSVLNDTTKRMYCMVKNVSIVDAVYEWCFVESDEEGNRRKLKSNQAFDILPIRGTLAPGEVETFEYSYFALPGVKLQSLAMCEVEGGPSYESEFVAESSVIKFAVEPQLIELGHMAYNRVVDKEVVVVNQGKVPFSFRVNLDTLSRGSVVADCSSLGGTIAAGGREILKLKVTPGIPDKIDEIIAVEVAHFEPVNVHVKINGLHPSILMSLPRVYDEFYRTAVEQASIILAELGPRKPPPSTGSKQRLPATRGRTADSTTRVDTAATRKAREELALATGPHSYQQSELEEEADRVHLCNFLLQKELEALDLKKTTAILVADAVANGIDPATVTGKPKGKKEDSRRRRKLPEEHTVLSRYVIDFGYVCRGTQRQRRFRMQNNSGAPLTVIADKHILANYGLEIDPDTVSKLPENEIVDMTLTFTSSAVELGPMQLECPVELRGGPSTMVTIKAIVEQPEIKLSADSLDFGRVQVGHKQIYTVRMYNNKNIAADWSIKKPMENNRDWDYFECIPDRGTLQPGQRFDLVVRFTPTLDKAAYRQRIPIKIQHNPRALSVVATGAMHQVGVAFDPPVLDLGAILPGEPGSVDEATGEPKLPLKPNEARFVMINTSEVPVELFCLDSDKKHLEEEEMLRNYEAFGESDEILLDPREPGAELWPEVVEAAKKRRAAERAEAARKKAEEEAAAAAAEAAAAEAAAEGGDDEGAAAKADAPAAPEEGEPEAIEEVGELEGVEPEPEVVPDDSLNVVVLGGPFGRSAALASRISERYGVPLATPDEVILAILKQEVVPPEVEVVEPVGPSPSLAPETPQPPAPEEPSEPVDEDAEGDAEEDEGDEEDEEDEEAEKAAEAEAEAEPEPEPEEPKELFERVKKVTGWMDDEEVAAKAAETEGDEAPPEEEAPAGQLDVALLTEVFECWLGQEACRTTDVGETNPPGWKMAAGGVVLDGLKCTYAPESVVLEALAAALGLAKREIVPEPPEEPEEGEEGEEAPPPPPPPQEGEEEEEEREFFLAGAKRLWIVNATITEEEVVRRHADAKAKAEAEAKAAAAAEAEAAGGEPAETGEEPADADASAPQRDGEEGAAADGDEPQEEGNGAEESVAALTAHTELVESALALVGVHTHAGAMARVLGVADDEAEDEDLYARVRGGPRELGSANGFPLALGEEPPIPPVDKKAIVRRPPARPPRMPVTHFTVLTPPPRPEPAEEDGEEAEEGAEKAPPPAEAPPPAKAKAAAKAAAAAEEEEEEEEAEELSAQARWVLPAQGRVELLVRFSSPEIGSFRELLCYEVDGSHDVRDEFVLEGKCAYPQINDDFRNVFYRRTRTKLAPALVAKQYVAPRHRFEFGPLLCAKDKPVKTEEANPAETSRFRITNNGLFDLTVRFGMKGLPADVELEEGHVRPNGVYSVDPEEMTLAIDETKDLTVFAFPSEEGPCADAVVCTIEHNPDVVEFPVYCEGAKPRVELDGVSEQSEGGPGGEVVFQRILVGHTDTRSVTVRNVCLLPVKWRIVGLDESDTTLSISETEGEIPAMGEHEVVLTFASEKTKVLNQTLRLEVVDVGELQEVAQTIAMPVKAEAYLIQTKVEFQKLGQKPTGSKPSTPAETSRPSTAAEGEKPSTPAETPRETPRSENAGKPSGIDFGVVRAVEDTSSNFKVTNTGKYPIEFRMHQKSALVRELFTISPLEGTIAPGKNESITVHFNKERTLKRTVALTANADTILELWEPLTGLKEEKIPIRIDVRAVFTTYTVRPLRGIVFGPHVYDTVAPPRTFTIENTGEFDFDFDLSDYGARERKEEEGEAGTQEKAPSRPVSPGKSPGKADAAPQEGEGDALVLGQFTVRPSSGNVKPGESQTIEVEFSAAHDRSYAEILGINVADRDPADSPGGMPYEIIGDSCVPGMSTDVNQIFEEHSIVNALDPFRPLEKVYALRDKAFSFGPTIAMTNKADTDDGADAGVTASLKITNTQKVQCTVNFSVAPKMDDPPEEFPITVTPETWAIPPQETRYVTLRFAPETIQTYVGLFEAVVENGVDPKTKSFSCEVHGEGTLPTITIEEPTEFTEDNALALNFPRLLQGKTLTRNFSLRNNGIIPATFRMNMPLSKDFSLGENGVPIRLEPKKAHVVPVTFTPSALGDYTAEVKMLVQHNRYETQRVVLNATCYLDLVTFEQLPGGFDDELHFEDGPVGAGRAITFALRNNGDTPVRFEWPDGLADLSFVPRAGHLKAKATKAITATFAPMAAAVTHDALEVVLKLAKIRYTGVESDDAVPEWDDRPAVVAYGEDGPADDGADGGAGDDVPAASAEPEPEPEHEVIPPEGDPKTATAPSATLKVHAVADNARYECDTKPVVFKSTMMYQSRVHSLPLKNASNAKLAYRVRIEPDAGPYEVSPTEGEIASNDTVMITVRFAPTEVEPCERTLHIDMDNLDAGVDAIAIPLSGRATRPWCHFELAESNYVSAGRRNPALPGPDGVVGTLAPETRVIEFNSLGTKVRNVVRFLALNPTNIAFEFQWTQLGAKAGAPPSVFRCNNRQGRIEGGRKYEMQFSFEPTGAEEDGTVESFWTFEIVGQGIVVPFLLVGTVSEPSVTFDRAAVNFERVLLGARGRETIYLCNNEAVPFAFNFDLATYEASEARLAIMGRKPQLSLEPSSGSVAPNSRFPIVATFSPHEEAPINYNVVCNVRKKPLPLRLNVKGVGYAIHETIQVQSADGMLTLSPGANDVDFGAVIIRDRSVKQVQIVNQGNVAFTYAFDCGSNPRVSVSPTMGTVGTGERSTCELVFNPYGPEKLENYRVALQIENGRKYLLNLTGAGHKPKLAFSWTSFSFGACFVHEKGMEPNATTLTITNEDAIDVNFDCSFVNTDFLEMDHGPTVLAPGESTDIAVRFTPRDAVHYKTSATFQVMGLYALPVTISGDGTPLAVDVAAGSKEVAFGALRSTSESVKVLSVTNRARIPAALDLDVAMPTLAQYGITAIPTGVVNLRGRETTTINLTYRPTGRMRPFKEEVPVTVQGVEKVLFSVSGACTGTELKLNTESINFGQVVLGSRLVKRLQIENSGDVGTKFAWDVAALGENFSISPAEGFLTPGQELKLNVTFHPTPAVVGSDARADRVVCSVEGGAGLHVTLSGVCSTQEPLEEAVTFDAPVRQIEKKTITIENTTAVAWHLQPVITNDFWTGPEFLNVPAGASADYELTYHPKAMTSGESVHEGSLFFGLPDGSGLLHKLAGTAGEPPCSGTVERELVAKEDHTEILTVSNWLPRAQRFVVKVEREKEAEDEEEDEAFQLAGPSHIDVPAHSERAYRMSAIMHREGALKARVTFLNESTGEFMFYDVSFVSGPAKSRGTVSLAGPVRQLITRTVRVANPLSKDVVLAATCENARVRIGKGEGSVLVPARSAADVELSFRPLAAAEETAKFTLSCEELGAFEWDLVLRGADAGLERVLTFNVPLGQRAVQYFRFQHYLDEKAEYECRFESGDAFECEASVTAVVAQLEDESGTSKFYEQAIEQEVEVAFEPTRLGEDFRDTLTVSHPIAGTFTCPVHGRCGAPKPQGPFDIPDGGKGGTFKFKNVFSKEAVFTFVCDNACFAVERTQTLPAKRTIDVNVIYKPAADMPSEAKLIVSCEETPATWVFYLKGAASA